MCDLLHMNIFMNDSSGMITSYDLLEAPGRPPIDLGVLFSKTADEEMFSRAVNMIGAIETASRLQTGFSGPAWGSWTIKEGKERGREITGPGPGSFFQKFFHEAIGGGGYCIACGAPMSYRRRTPFCPKCMSIRNGQAGPDERGYYCHNCGAAARVTLSVPFCRRCLSDTMTG